jgi:5-methylcytosine-specific restriction endonuclease McrA
MGKWRRNKSKTRRWQRNHLINKFGNICYICEQKMESMKDMTIDHLIPFSRGGFDLLENYRLVHAHCNQLKANMTPEEFEVFQKGGEKVE